MEEVLKSKKAIKSKEVISEKYLIFYLDGQLFALPGEQILEIISIQAITYMPKLPSFIKGIVNIRGKIVPLVDLRLRLGKTAKEYDDDTCIILVEIDNTIAGLIVDNVKDVMDIPVKSLHPVSQTSANQDYNRFITNICTIGDEIILLLCAVSILGDNFS